MNNTLSTGIPEMDRFDEPTFKRKKHQEIREELAKTANPEKQKALLLLERQMERDNYGIEPAERINLVEEVAKEEAQKWAIEI